MEQPGYVPTERWLAFRFEQRLRSVDDQVRRRFMVLRHEVRSAGGEPVEMATQLVALAVEERSKGKWNVQE